MAVAGALDMSLDDVIKKKGSRGGGGGGGRNGAKKGKKAERKEESGKGGAAAGARAATARRLSEVATRAASERPAAKAGGGGGEKAGAREPLGVLSAAFRGLGLPARTLGVKPVDRPAPDPKPARAAKASGGKRGEQKPARAAPAGPAPRGTEDKLSMSLEDMIKHEVKRPGRKSEREGKADGKGAEGGGSKRGGRKRRGMMKLRKEESAGPKGKAKAKAKTRARGRGAVEWGKGSGKGWGGEGGGGLLQRARARAGEGGARAKRGRLYDDYDDWGPPPSKRMRAASAGDFGWGSSRARALDDGYSWGGSTARRREEPGWSRDWDDRVAPARERQREPRVTRVPQGPDLPARPAREAPSRAERARGFTTIRVSNVPRNLDKMDIKDAFEDNGRVVKCEVERGVAYVTFDNPRDAQQAVQTFDRGELNGQTIFVTPEQ